MPVVIGAGVQPHSPMQMYALTLDDSSARAIWRAQMMQNQSVMWNLWVLQRTIVTIHTEGLHLTLQASMAATCHGHALANLWAERCNIDDLLSFTDNALDGTVDSDELFVTLLLASDCIR